MCHISQQWPEHAVEVCNGQEICYVNHAKCFFCTMDMVIQCQSNTILMQNKFSNLQKKINGLVTQRVLIIILDFFYGTCANLQQNWVCTHTHTNKIECVQFCFCFFYFCFVLNESLQLQTNSTFAVYYSDHNFRSQISLKNLHPRQFLLIAHDKLW